MLSQRIALFSNLLVSSSQAERPLFRTRLKETVELMAQSHLGLIQGDKQLGLPGTMSPTVRAMYFSGPNPLDMQISTYEKTANALLQERDDALTPDNHLLKYINSQASISLLNALDQVVRQYQMEGEISIKILKNIETILWLATLLLLMSEVALIFHPFAKHLRAVIGKLQDTTNELELHKVNLEALVRSRTSELEHKSKELAEAKEAALSLAKLKADFLANMSHEIRTPMNAIVGLSHLALNKEVPDEVRDYLEKINTSSESLLGILNDILDFSKIEAGKLAIEHTPFNLNIVLDNLYNLFSFRAKEKQLEFSIEVAKGTPTYLIGDSLRIQQLLSNVVGNAIKFTEQGHVLLHVGQHPSESAKVKLTFSVEDSGIGMTAAEQQKLFIPFCQADNSTTRRFGGTGLGLTISRNLLRLMGSDFHVVSVPGKGTTFSFDLLLDIATPEQRIEPNHSHGERKAGVLTTELSQRGETLQGCRILVAEDNRINQLVVKEFLQLSGITVDIANNGLEALQLLEQNSYAAILMDVHMPEMGGVEATKLIRKNTELSHLPIIALTAGVTQEEHDNCKSSGMNDFVPKPFNPENLIATLTRWIKNKPSRE